MPEVEVGDVVYVNVRSRVGVDPPTGAFVSAVGNETLALTVFHPMIGTQHQSGVHHKDDPCFERHGFGRKMCWYHRKEHPDKVNAKATPPAPAVKAEAKPK
jgi:hypothetical protein